MQEYIVYMGSLPKGSYMAASRHLSLLQEVVPTSTSIGSCLTRSFKKSFNGFAAMLTEMEAQLLAGKGDVVSVFPSRKLKLQTTRSWDFMGFNEAIISKIPKNTSENIVIGVIDSGIWPESESFRDEGFGDPPPKWKGACRGGKNFTCNKKLIGARYYKSSDSARDENGHGTHTASTAAGNMVKDANFYGLANGSAARGGLPSARIAAYKVCDGTGCDTDAILSAFDDAIADGVDIISISIGYDSATPFDEDSIAIGAFHAVAKGILTVQSAGNSGPILASTPSVAPWKLSVAASTTDRRILTRVVLGNGKTLTGTSVNSFVPSGNMFPLIHGKNAAASNCSEDSAGDCEDGCLDSNLVKGKFVICQKSSQGKEAKRAGAIGSILSTSSLDYVSVLPLPGALLSSNEFGVVKLYENSTKSPQAKILRSEAVNDSTAPFVASFSSRGPNHIAPDILKISCARHEIYMQPDISAPGVGILAAFSPVAPPSGDSLVDTRSVKYSILSGTSMACPHVAGVAAYVKASHPDWSPSAIKSAIMTSARPMNVTRNPEGEFGYGSGHINPVEAINPGLVYEASKDDYVRFLCSFGYDPQTLSRIAGEKNITCPTSNDNGSQQRDVNYPSMTAQVPKNESFKIVFHRTVTNVGVAESTYKALVISSPNLKIQVVPQFLSFKSLKENKSFTVTVSSSTSQGFSAKILESASLTWSSGKHSVRSPIVVYNLYE
ncbi:hypothetical protein Tsubulata_041293 [Turnera subulata]|uniref:Uncharacterized protein n=1 Tax=Turnera subulata TaxID=218843 RepID=A0A9Q0IYD8_9ROSI|nr:hypothetical protein Tsubulata_041293 [Turnera subulata]